MSVYVRMCYSQVFLDSPSNPLHTFKYKNVDDVVDANDDDGTDILTTTTKCTPHRNALSLYHIVPVLVVVIARLDHRWRRVRVRMAHLRRLIGVQRLQRHVQQLHDTREVRLCEQERITTHSYTQFGRFRIPFSAVTTPFRIKKSSTTGQLVVLNSGENTFSRHLSAGSSSNACTSPSALVGSKSTGSSRSNTYSVFGKMPRSLSNRNETQPAGTTSRTSDAGMDASSAASLCAVSVMP